MQFASIRVTSFTKLRLFFHKVSFLINTPFPTLRETLYDGRVKFPAPASELFRLDVVRKTASSECILQGSIEMEFGDEDSSTGLAELFELVALTSFNPTHFAPN
jgi:hypothetical protein